MSAPVIEQFVGIHDQKKVSIINTTKRTIVALVASDPSELQMRKVSVAVYANSSSENVSKVSGSFELVNRDSAGISTVSVPPSRTAIVSIPTKEVYISAFAKSSTGDWYIITDKRHFFKFTEWTITNEHVKNNLGRIKILTSQA